MEMPKLPKREKRSTLNPTSQMAFAVAFCAFAAAGIGLIVNSWLTGWMAVGGMCGVGLFYMAIGILNLRPKQVDFDEIESNISQRTAGADNLVGEPVSRTRHRSANSPDAPRLMVQNDEEPSNNADE